MGNRFLKVFLLLKNCNLIVKFVGLKKTLKLLKKFSKKYLHLGNLVVNSPNLIFNIWGKMKMEKKRLDFTAYTLIILGILYSAISLFGNTFLVAFFLQVSSENVPNVALFYMITYLVMLITSPLFMAMVKRTKRVGFYRLGILFKCAFILLIALLKEKITGYVIGVAILNGLSEMLYWTAYNVMKNEILSSKILMKFTEVNSIISKVVNLVLPILLGAAIEYSSFLNISFYVLGIAFVQFIFSFFIKNPNATVANLHLKEFIQNVKKPEMKPLRDSYKICLYNGIKAVIGTLTTLVIMMTYNSNMSLGVISSLFTVLSIIVTFIFFKMYKPEKSKWLYIVCGVLPVLAAIGMLISLNKTTFIIYNTIYTICMVGPEFILDIVRNRTIREVGMHKYIAEHQVVSEIVLNSGRIFAYGMLFVLSIFQSAILFKICLVLAMLILPVVCVAIYKMEIEMVNYHKAKKEKVEEKVEIVENNEPLIQEEKMDNEMVKIPSVLDTAKANNLSMLIEEHKQDVEPKEEMVHANLQANDKQEKFV